jgi:catechol 2,3-dioxygenase-like lactoylglutathione lyase family enzyme/predicted enzyme related to lactoylglutathione lyase
VPDVTDAAKFYSRVFNPAIYKEQKPPLRYYVTLDPGYIALGTRDGEDKAFIDHDCALLPVYNRAAMNERLKQEGLPAGRYGVIHDPDGLGLQLLGAPGGLAPSTEPAQPVVSEPPLLRPRGLSHVVILSANLTASAGFYRKFFGPEEKGGGAEGYTFKAANTRWVLQPVPAGEKPRIDRFGVHVAPFDVKAVAKAIEGLGGTIVASGDGHLHFKGPEGLAVEVNAVDPARIWGLG